MGVSRQEFGQWVFDHGYGLTFAQSAKTAKQDANERTPADRSSQVYVGCIAADQNKHFISLNDYLPYQSQEIQDALKRSA